METVRTHRVGTLTAGLSFITFGVLFLLHLFINAISYDLIFKLWPFIIIGLGIELLLSNFTNISIIYDKAAVVLVFLITFFAMGMAGADLFIQNIRFIN